MAEYGDAELVKHDDGTITVRHADDLIGVAAELIEHIPMRDGLLVLDTAGEYRYRMVGLAEEPNTILCERVR